MLNYQRVPSGKRLHNYGKSPFIVDFPIKMVDLSIVMLVITRGYIGRRLD